MVRSSVTFRNIRFWDIGCHGCKSCLVVIEAATENKGLHQGVPGLFEATEAGETGRRSHTG